MRGSLKLVIPLLIILGIVLGAVYFFTKPPVSEESESVDQARVIDVGKVTNKQEPEAGQGSAAPIAPLPIDQETASQGKFESVASGKIVIKRGNDLYSLGLASGEIAVMCTTQELAGLFELDLNKVADVKIATPDTLSTFVDVGQDVVVLSQPDEFGTYLAHTVAIDAASCVQN